MFVGTGRPPRSSSGTASTKTPWAGLPSRRSVRYFEHVEAQTLILGVEQFRPACFLAWPAAFCGAVASTILASTARQMEAAHRASLAKGEVGIREKKAVPTLANFISERFEPWAEASTSAKTWIDYYRPGIRTIRTYKPLANLRLNEVTSEKASEFAAWRQLAGLQA